MWRDTGLFINGPWQNAKVRSVYLPRSIVFPRYSLSWVGDMAVHCPGIT